MGKKKYDDTRDSLRAQNRIRDMVNEIPKAVYDRLALENPLFRAFVTGYYAEEKLQEYLDSIVEISGIYKPGDTHPTQNKWDRTFLYKGIRYSVQVKSPATGSIQTDLDSGNLVATVHNDASDKRLITLPNGQDVQTCCYLKGEYDLLAVPLYLFEGLWRFGFKWNKDCRLTKSKNLTEEQRFYLLSTTEDIEYPIQEDSSWEEDLIGMLEFRLEDEYEALLCM